MTHPYLLKQARAVTHPGCMPLVNELADEIGHLNAEIERLNALYKAQGDTVKHLEESNERLADEIEQLTAAQTRVRAVLPTIERNDECFEKLEAEVAQLNAANERLRAFAQQVVDTLTAAKRAASEGK